MAKTEHSFGGNWTDEKLSVVNKYLNAYVKIMSKHNFRFAYIDAFAGTGYRSIKTEDNPLLDNLGEPEIKFLDGSARIALKIVPPFSQYIFIEKSTVHASELECLKSEFPNLSDKIKIVNDEANDYLLQLCQKDWSIRRAVLFLDPYGMQVRWDTIKVIANTKAIDLWLLFPLGVAVNRMLPKDGSIDPSWRKSLDEMFGTTDWSEEFYKTKTDVDLFGSSSQTQKTGDFDTIAKYFVNRLKTVFSGVAENPLQLMNSRNSPLYLLCFAAGNPVGAKTAIKIAQDILRTK